MPFAIQIIEEEKDLYAEIYPSNKGIVDFNYTLLQISKKKLAEIDQSKEGAFRQ